MARGRKPKCVCDLPKCHSCADRRRHRKYYSNHKKLLRSRARTKYDLTLDCDDVNKILEYRLTIYFLYKGYD